MRKQKIVLAGITGCNLMLVISLFYPFVW